MSEQKTGDSVPTVEELSEQVKNLNSGIAKYRDEAQKASEEAKSAKAEAVAAKAEAEAAKKATQGKKDEDPKLSPEDEKRLEEWAKKKGLVSKEELEAEKGRMFNESLKNIESQAITEFISTHPEYEKSENWEKIKKEFAQYKQPTSITGYRNILNKIHKEFVGVEEAEAKVRAQQEQRKRLGLGGGGSRGESTEETLESLQEKYPNLSADQIQDRLQEIKNLTEARAKKQAAKASRRR